LAVAVEVPLTVGAFAADSSPSPLVGGGRRLLWCRDLHELRGAVAWAAATAPLTGGAGELRGSRIGGRLD
jgi:hypothetical protein